MRNIALAIVLGVIGPAAFLLVVGPGLATYHGTAQELGFSDIFEACPSLREVDTAFRAECGELEFYGELKPIAWALLVLSVALPLINFALPYALGKHRALLGHVYAAVFPIVIIASILILIAGVALASLAAHILLKWTFEVIWHFLYIVIGIGALGLLAAIFTAISKSFSKSRTTEFGCAVSPKDVPGLNAIINKLSEELGAQRPQNIILGASPNFYVTNAPIKVLPSGKKLNGETIFISATLAKLLNKKELSAVIAHELMHYKGDDLTYTKKFYPLYKTLSNFQREISGTEHIFSLPIVANLAVLEESFAKSERRISREREFEADRGAADATSATAIASALMKITTFSYLWRDAIQDNAEALQIGDFIQNAAHGLYGYVVYECPSEFIDERRREVLSQSITHPTDTHPTTADRLSALGIDPNTLETEYFERFEQASNEDGSLILADAHLAEVTNAFHLQTVLQTGVRVPAENDEAAKRQRVIDHLLYQVIEHFIRIDGSLDPEEVKEAEARACKLFPGFNPLVFREGLHSQYAPHDPDKLAEYAGKLLTRTGLSNLAEVIDAVIEADGRVDAAEDELRSRFMEIAQRACDEADRIDAGS